MEALLEPQSRRANLLLHCGAHAVDRTIIGTTPTPEPTATWTPLPHMALVQEVEQVLKTNGLSVVNQAHSLTHDGLRYFGLMEIQNSVIHHDYAWVLGLRNSHDKSFPADIVAGANVFVCDNLSFSGEIKIARKHTRFILRDLPFLTERAIGRLMERWHHQDQRISAYKRKEPVGFFGTRLNHSCHRRSGLYSKADPSDAKRVAKSSTRRIPSPDTLDAVQQFHGSSERQSE